MCAGGSRNSSRRVAPTEKRPTQHSVFEKAGETPSLRCQPSASSRRSGSRCSGAWRRTQPHSKVGSVAARAPVTSFRLLAACFEPLLRHSRCKSAYLCRTTTPGSAPGRGGPGVTSRSVSHATKTNPPLPRFAGFPYNGFRKCEERRKTVRTVHEKPTPGRWSIRTSDEPPLHTA